MGKPINGNLSEAAGFLRAADGKLKFEERRLLIRREIRPAVLKAALCDLSEAAELIEERRRHVVLMLAEVDEINAAFKVGGFEVEVVPGRESEASKALNAERIAAACSV
jgi:hypothetical protein